MSDRQQRMVFGEDAELYDRVRPAYPLAVIDAVVAMAGPAESPMPRRAVEVGAGTGKATVAVATTGVAVTAVEPDEQMAAVLRRNVAGLPVTVELGGFEVWDPVPADYDLLYSAQAWHWIDPQLGYVRAGEALRPGGGLALFWHRTHWPEDDPLRAELDDLYRRLAPELHAREPGCPGNGYRHRPHADLDGEARSSGWFTDTETTFVEWPASFDATTYTDLLRTQSDHRLYDPSAVDLLMDAVTELVAAHGGRIHVPYATLLFTATRVDR